MFLLQSAYSPAHAVQIIFYSFLIGKSWHRVDSYWFLAFGRLGSQRCNLFLSYGGLENSWLGDNFYLVLVTWTIEESWLSRDSYWFLSYGRLRNLGLAKILAGFCPMQDWGILAWLRFLLVLVKWKIEESWLGWDSCWFLSFVRLRNLVLAEIFTGFPHMED